MHFKILGCSVTAALAILVSACVDDNYDLSDIDTTTRIQLKDLTLPVNIKDVTLSDIITFDDDSKIKPVTINGRQFYALTESGDFDSEPIYIEKVTAAAPHLDPTARTLQMVIDESRAPRRAGEVDPSTFNCTYHIVEMGNDFSYDANDIDPSVIQLYSARIEPITFSIHLQALNVNDATERMTFTGLHITMPKGLAAEASHGSYDPATGIWTIDSYEVEGTEAFASLVADAVDFEANGCKIDKNHTLHFDSSFRVNEGTLTIEPKFVGGKPVPLPSELEFTVEYALTDLTVNSLDGEIQYTLDGMDIDPVSLSDIPDFLSGDETNIGLANPQIYLQVNNPVADNSLNCRTGITLTAIRDNGTRRPFSPDAGSFTIGHGNASGLYNFVLAPSDADLSTPDRYAADLEFVKFSTLGNILRAPEGTAGEGLPQSIGIRLDDPQIYPQRVTGFDLGRHIPGVKGNYDLVAPLALSEGSMIVYSDRETGWNDEDVDAITIQGLSVSFTATNSCPVGVELLGYPLDKDGKRIPGVVLSTEKRLEAGAKDQPVTIVMTGPEFRHLDGIEYVARVNAGPDAAPLAPSQTIALSNIRATVSGYYEKEL